MSILPESLYLNKEYLRGRAAESIFGPENRMYQMSMADKWSILRGVKL